MLNKTIDLSKKAKPTGWRFSGKKKKLGSRYYKRPENVLTDKGFTRAKNSGMIYYESRLSKGDLNQTRKFEFGGAIKDVKSMLNKRITINELFEF